MRRFPASRAPATCSAPNLAKRSWCSTTMVVTVGSERSFKNFLCFPLSAEPISVTTFNRAPVGGGQGGDPRHLGVEVGLLVSRGHTGTDRSSAGGRPILAGEVPHHDEPTHPLCGYRQPALPEPPIGGLGMDALGLSPLSSAHSAKFITAQY